MEEKTKEAKKPRKKKEATTEKSEKDPRRASDGKFVEGNEIGKETRFKPGEQNGVPFKKGHTLSKKYRDEYADLLLEYFRRDDIVFPTLEGYVEWVASITGEAISYEAALLWANTDTEYAQQFKDIYRQAKAIQRDKLIFGGLTKRFDPTFARFLASSLHDMREKTEQKIEGSGEFKVRVSYFEDE